MWVSVSVQEGGLCPGGEVSVQGGGLCPGGSLSREVIYTWSLSRGSLSRGVSVQGVSVRGSLCPGGSLSLSRETPRTVTSGRYTSYWNAFL